MASSLLDLNSSAPSSVRRRLEKATPEEVEGRPKSLLTRRFSLSLGLAGEVGRNDILELTRRRSMSAMAKRCGYCESAAVDSAAVVEVRKVGRGARHRTELFLDFI